VPVSANHKESGLSVTVVICSRNRPTLLGKCLEAVAALNPAPDDVLVVDNSEGDQETQSTARKFSARYTVEATPGLSRARNRGMAESNTDIVAYLDDDATPDEHWLGYILEPFTEPQVASVSGTIVFVGSNEPDRSREGHRRLTNQDPQWFEIATFGGLGWGSNMALRKAACAGGTAFDVRLGRGAPIGIAEENHAFASLVSRGYQAVFVPEAIVYHPSTNGNIERRASSSMAYWLLLFSDFPDHRRDLLRFLFRRLRRKPLTWPRNPQTPGDIINSGWRVYLRAGFRGGLIFLRSRKLKQK
jgi:cellulose synthase/poly-beta-1,6-N-acetylglucosamine synthase-like glycosyltransferase